MTSDELKMWFQENLRIIVSMLIISAIALGIYSYSQRSAEYMETPNTVDVRTETHEDTPDNSKASLEKECEEYGWKKISELPAKCVKFYQ